MMDTRTFAEQIAFGEYVECSAETFGATYLDQAAMCGNEATWVDADGHPWCPQHQPFVEWALSDQEEQ